MLPKLHQLAMVIGCCFLLSTTTCTTMAQSIAEQQPSTTTLKQQAMLVETRADDLGSFLLLLPLQLASLPFVPDFLATILLSLEESYLESVANSALAKAKEIVEDESIVDENLQAIDKQITFLTSAADLLDSENLADNDKAVAMLKSINTSATKIESALSLIDPSRIDEDSQKLLDDVLGKVRNLKNVTQED